MSIGPTTIRRKKVWGRDFNGTNQAMWAARAGGTTSSLAVSAWVRYGDVGAVAAFYDGNSNSTQYSFRVLADGRLSILRVNTSGTWQSRTTDVLDTIIPNDGKLHHVVLSVGGTAESLTNFYIDGRWVAHNNATWSGTFNGWTMDEYSVGAWLRDRQDGSSLFNHWYDGHLYEVAIWRVPVNAQIVRALARGMSPLKFRHNLEVFVDMHSEVNLASGSAMNIQGSSGTLVRNRYKPGRRSLAQAVSGFNSKRRAIIDGFVGSQGIFDTVRSGIQDADVKLVSPVEVQVNLKNITYPAPSRSESIRHEGLPAGAVKGSES